MTPLSFHANGKLLLSGEYFVLDGAQAIGLPCRFGQSLEILPHDSTGLIYWKSQTVDHVVWFEATFRLSDFSVIKTSDVETSERLQQILRHIRILNPDFLAQTTTLNVMTHLEFPRLWGLGTSSTLIYNLAKWGEVDPFDLSSKTLGGSGYDIACAGVDTPILYQIKDTRPIFEPVNFDPLFKNQLYFVYLSKKQNSREGIQRYRTKVMHNAGQVDEVSALSNAFLKAKTLIEFQKVVLTHEELISQAIEMPKVQDLYFSDFDGVVKSLGAWGGDFVLAATKLEPNEAKSYFNKKGFETFLEYGEMIQNGIT